jgi:hypothetical protein
MMNIALSGLTQSILLDRIVKRSTGLIALYDRGKRRKHSLLVLVCSNGIDPDRLTVLWKEKLHFTLVYLLFNYVNTCLPVCFNVFSDFLVFFLVIILCFW